MKPLSIVVLLCGILLCSCAEKPVPVLPIPQSVSVTEKVQKIEPGLNQARDLNSEMKGEVGILKREATNARQLAEVATAEAKRMSDAGQATKAELDDQWKALQALTVRNLFLETEIERHAAKIHDQEKALSEARAATSDAVAAGAMTDTANAYLTDQIRSVTTQYQSAESGRQKASTDLALSQKAESDAKLAYAARAAEIWAWRIGIGLYVVGRLLKLLPGFREKLFWLP